MSRQCYIFSEYDAKLLERFKRIRERVDDLLGATLGLYFSFVHNPIKEWAKGTKYVKVQ